MDSKARRILEHHFCVECKEGEGAVEGGVIVTCRRLLRHIHTIRASHSAWLSCGIASGSMTRTDPPGLSLQD